LFTKPGYGKSKKSPFPGNSRNRDPGSQTVVTMPEHQQSSISVLNVNHSAIFFLYFMSFRCCRCVRSV